MGLLLSSPQPYDWNEKAPPSGPNREGTKDLRVQMGAAPNHLQASSTSVEAVLVQQSDL